VALPWRRFDIDGAYLGRWGSLGGGEGQFQSLAGIAVAADGSVYVADPALDRLQHFDALGAYISSWGTEGGGAGEPPVSADHDRRLAPYAR